MTPKKSFIVDVHCSIQANSAEEAATVITSALSKACNPLKGMKIKVSTFTTEEYSLLPKSKEEQKLIQKMREEKTEEFIKRFQSPFKENKDQDPPPQTYPTIT